MHVDGGANVNICTNKQLFYIYKPVNSSVQAVTGQTTKCEGVGIIIIRFPNTDFTIPLYPVYHMPNNPQNTLGTPALNFYNRHLL